MVGRVPIALFFAGAVLVAGFITYVIAYVVDKRDGMQVGLIAMVTGGIVVTAFMIFYALEAIFT